MKTARSADAAAPTMAGPSGGIPGLVGVPGGPLDGDSGHRSSSPGAAAMTTLSINPASSAWSVSCFVHLRRLSSPGAERVPTYTRDAQRPRVEHEVRLGLGLAKGTRPMTTSPTCEAVVQEGVEGCLFRGCRTNGPFRSPVGDSPIRPSARGTCLGPARRTRRHRRRPRHHWRSTRRRGDVGVGRGLICLHTSAWDVIESIMNRVPGSNRRWKLATALATTKPLDESSLRCSSKIMSSYSPPASLAAVAISRTPNRRASGAGEVLVGRYTRGRTSRLCIQRPADRGCELRPDPGKSRRGRRTSSREDRRAAPTQGAANRFQAAAVGHDGPAAKTETFSACSHVF